MLLVNTITVFLTVTAGVQIADLRGSRRLLATKEEPTGFRVALGIRSRRPYNADHAHLDVARLLEVEVMPDTHLDFLTLSIGPVPALVGCPVGSRVLTGKSRSVFFGRSSSARFWRRRMVEHSVLGKSQQQVTGRIGHQLQEGHAAVIAIPNGDRAFLEPRSYFFYLIRSRLALRLVASDPDVIENVSPTARCLRQHGQRRELPSWSNRFATFWQVALMHISAIGRRFRTRTRNG